MLLHSSRVRISITGTPLLDLLGFESDLAWKFTTSYERLGAAKKKWPRVLQGRAMYYRTQRKTHAVRRKLGLPSLEGQELNHNNAGKKCPTDKEQEAAP